MRIFDRFLIFVLVVVIALLGIGLIAVCFEPYEISQHMMILMQELVRWRWLCLVLGAILVIVAVILLLVSVFHRSGSKSKHTTVETGIQGSNVQVSISAIEVMVSQVVKNYRDIRSFETDIHQESGGIVLRISIVVSDRANIPELSSRLQSEIKTQLEDAVGLKLKNVKIIIKDVVLAGAYDTMYGSNDNKQEKTTAAETMAAPQDSARADDSSLADEDEKVEIVIESDTDKA
jgi:uncharacterized alkaline shock family protein YloU